MVIIFISNKSSKKVRKQFLQTTKSNFSKFIYHPLGKVHCLVLHIAKQT